MYHVISNCSPARNEKTMCAPLHPIASEPSNASSGRQYIRRSDSIYLSCARNYNTASSWVQMALHPAPRGADFGRTLASNLHPLTGGS